MYAHKRWAVTMDVGNEYQKDFFSFPCLSLLPVLSVVLTQRSSSHGKIVNELFHTDDARLYTVFLQL